MSAIEPSSYRWPAEWETHEATWLSWPVNPNTWPGIFEQIPADYARFVAAIACFEPVRILTANAAAADEARRLTNEACEAAAAKFPVDFIDIAVNDSWCRDYGPIFLNRRPEITSGDAQIMIDWDYNAWGGKYPPWDHDAQVARKIAHLLNCPRISPGIILEGGAIEGNGAGTVLTTENCLLNPNRNPDLNRLAMEGLLRRYLNCERVVWLPGHGIIGDDTDGHIDQVARFADRLHVLVAAPHNDDAEEATALRANRDAVLAARTATGESLQVTDLKMPSPKFEQGHRLPACYCNFYIVNGGVIVPTFRDAADDEALVALQAAFPDRRIVGVDALKLIWGLGAFHCMTQQQPAIII